MRDRPRADNMRVDSMTSLRVLKQQRSQMLPLTLSRQRPGISRIILVVVSCNVHVLNASMPETGDYLQRCLHIASLHQNVPGVREHPYPHKHIYILLIVCTW